MTFRRDVNTIFEGNQQQDAHELLVCLLDNIRETFQLFVRTRENQFNWRVDAGTSTQVDLLQDRTVQLESNKRGNRKLQKQKKKPAASSVRASSASGLMQTSLNGMCVRSSTSGVHPLENGSIVPPTINGDINTFNRLENKKCFISEDFEGVSLLRTTCLECEQVTERKETFCDICVPIDRSNEKGLSTFLSKWTVLPYDLTYSSDFYATTANALPS
jgi:ubiquitin carboxyl-terminal hydrolase 1